MNSNCAWPALVAALLLGTSVDAVRAVDWKTSDGKVYQDVKLIKLDEDSVTILYADGGARIPLAKLSPDLQRRFGYDPEEAKLLAEARAQEAAENARALQAEMDKASEMHQAGKESPVETTSTATSDDATGAQNSPSPPPVSGSATHHFMDEISTSASGEKAAADPSHHSIDEAAQSATAMRPSLSDPNYHTMAHMFYTVRKDGLGPDPTDTSHHTMDEATAGATGQK